MSCQVAGPGIRRESRTGRLPTARGTKRWASTRTGRLRPSSWRQSSRSCKRDNFYFPPFASRRTGRPINFGDSKSQTQERVMNAVSSGSSISPFLWFDQNAHEAAEFYISIFPNSRKVSELKNPQAQDKPPL